MRGRRAIFGFPVAAKGQRVGLLGGSFDPPHAGHVHITRRAIRRLGLDRVWWLVSPGNPLKEDAPASLARRMGACRALVHNPKVQVTDLEARLGVRHTAETVRLLQARYPGVRFVWLMGADNLRGFHRWEDWRTIMERVPVAVLARPGEQVRAGLSPAAQAYARYRLPREAARALPLTAPPAWILLSGPMIEMSSTSIRARGGWMR